MTEFLSPEWFHSLEARLATITLGTRGEPGLRLGQIVTGAPEGTVSYTICLGAGEAGTLERDSVETAQVVLVEDHESARSIVNGYPPAALLAEGKIKVRGDVNVLLGASTELSALATALEAGAA